MKIYNEKTLESFCSKVTIIKEGYLEKKKPDNETYQRRYFILTGNILRYYEKKNDKEPLGCIIIEQHAVDLRGEFTFAITFGSSQYHLREYVLRAKGSKEVEDWMYALTKCDIQNARALLRWLESKRCVASTSSEGITRLQAESFYPRKNPFNITEEDQIDHLKWLIQYEWRELHEIARKNILT